MTGAGVLRRLTFGVVVVAVLGGCSNSTPGAASESINAVNAAPTAELQEYYSQQLAWEKCGPGQQCATLTVPVDYADPGGRTVELSVLRSLATGPEPQGSLVVNPGGPGGSGVDYAMQAASALSPKLRSAYSIVGFDPRGVKRSDAIECLSDEERDEFLAQDPSPDDEDDVERIAADGQRLAAGCAADDAELLAHVSTAEVAADMDVLRAALGEERLNYLGFSYGTYLGVLYAESFPDRVGRMVLDGGIDPTLSNSEISLGQALGFEVSLRRYLADCVDTGECPLGNSVDEAYDTLQAFLADLETQPLPTSDPERPLTQGLAVNSLAYPLYTPDYGWPLLTANLRRALAGDGAGLLDIVDLFTRRDTDGTYDDNGLDMLFAVNCVDRSDRPSMSEVQQLAAEWSQQAPIFGAPLAFSNVACERWPVPVSSVQATASADGVPPIVVIGTQFDPATPYEWSVALAGFLGDGRLVSRMGGDGHTAYRGGSRCIDEIIDAYLITGSAPPDGTECVD